MTLSVSTNPAPVWNAADYAANSAQQQAWARELIARLKLRGDEHVLDVGCGDGKVTAEIARSLPNGAVVGIDASPQMIEFAQATFASDKVPNLGFRVMDARRIQLDPSFDLVFSNAALHWISDHEAFLQGAATCLRPGGRLITSCGGKGNAQDIFVALRPVMREARWREYFRKMETPYFFYSPEDYQRWLPECGFAAGSARLAPKDAVYDGAAGFASVLRTTWLPYTQRVPEPLHEEFIAAIVKRYVARHPPDADGRVHVRMVRLEIDAVKV